MIEQSSKRRVWIFFTTCAFLIGLFLGASFDRKELMSAKSVKATDITSVINLYSKNRSDKVDFDQFWQVWDLVKKNYVAQPVDDTKLFYGALEGIARGLGDPYTVYFPPKEAQAFAEDLSGSLEGIGAEIGIKDDFLVVVAPLADSPAEKAGLKPGDKILKINDEDTTGISIDKAVHKIRGAEGTVVTLSVFPKNGEAVKEVRIVRAKINIPSVKTEMKTANIAYIRLASFDENTQEQFESAINTVRTNKAKGIVLDLRSNPGGFLDTAVSVASAWVTDGTIVVEKGKDGVSNERLAVGSHGFAGIPTVVLVDDGSASASEIVAGALQDYGLATIVGIKTYGKGSVQEFEGLPDGSALKVTVAKWYTPKGRSIDHDGIEPDFVIEKMFEIKEGKDPVDLGLKKAIELLEQKIK